MGSIAAMGSEEGLLRLLLEHGENASAKIIFGWTPLPYAMWGREAVARLLLDHGADVATARTCSGVGWDSPGASVKVAARSCRYTHERLLQGKCFRQHGCHVRTPTEAVSEQGR
jgi:hypothetical protein